MMNIREIDTLKLSNFINEFRRFLIQNEFFEHTIYSLIPYKIENTDYFKLNNNFFLRYGTEPEIWKIGKYFDKFFCVNSLFRKEKILTKIHNFEFKILDFYIKGGSIQKVTDIFLKLLRKVEETLKLKKLSGLPITYISYEDFHKKQF